MTPKQFTYHLMDKNIKDWKGTKNLTPDEWYKIMEEYAQQVKASKKILYDKVGKREVSTAWYLDFEGFPYIDLDPHGVDMSGKRTIAPAYSKRYELRDKPVK